MVRNVASALIQGCPHLALISQGIMRLKFWTWPTWKALRNSIDSSRVPA